MIKLSEFTRDRLNATFASSERERVAHFLEEQCGDTLPLVDSSYTQLAERIRCAVLKRSGGDFEQLVRWVDAAKTDWRDVLLAADYGDVDAHRKDRTR